MLYGVLDLFKSCFLFVYTSLVSIKLTETMSYWDFIFTIFIAFSVISIVFRTLGGSGIMSATGSTTSAIDTKKRASEREAWQNETRIYREQRLEALRNKRR